MFQFGKFRQYWDSDLCSIISN